MLKRFISLVLCLLLASSCLFLVACNGDGEATSSTGEANGDDDGFLNEAKDWPGETVTILGYNGQYSYQSVQIDSTERTNEAVEDAFYERNNYIEEKYKLNIEAVLPELDEWHINMIRTDISSNLNEYDAYCIPITYVAPLAVEGLLQDFNSVGNDYLHLDQAWWDQTLIRDVKINDRVYFLAGDALVEDDEATWAVFFNKDLFSVNAALAATLGEYSSVYDLVLDGKWTLDKMYEMIQTVNRTTAGTKSYETSRQVGGDQWGMVTQSYDFYLFMLGCEQKMVDTTGDLPVLRVTEEENIRTFDGVSNILFDKVNVGMADDYGKWNEGIYDVEKEIFAIGNALFMPGAIANVGMPTLREAEIHYGILPMPKRSELQKEYSSSITVYHCAVFSMPTTCKKAEAACYALEAMAFYGKKIVTPEYYDRTLTLKRFEDQESKDMLDLIFRNRTYDLGAIFNFGQEITGDGTLGFYTNLFGAKSKDIMSSYERNKNTYQTGLESFIAQAYN